MYKGNKNIELTKESIVKLINMYKERPALWRVNHESYRNKNFKKKKYQEIVNAFRDEYPEVNIHYIKGKIQNLRSSYRKEIKKVEASERCSTGDDDLHEPHLWYFNMLAFTRDQDGPLPSVSNLESSESCPSFVPLTQQKVEPLESSENEVELGRGNEIADMEFDFTMPQLQRNLNVETEIYPSEFITKCNSATNTPSTSSDDCAALGTYVAEKLRKMDDGQQILAEALIQKVITKGLKKQLTDFTDLLEAMHHYHDFSLPDHNNDGIPPCKRSS